MTCFWSHQNSTKWISVSAKTTANNSRALPANIGINHRTLTTAASLSTNKTTNKLFLRVESDDEWRYSDKCWNGTPRIKLARWWWLVLLSKSNAQTSHFRFSWALSRPQNAGIAVFNQRGTMARLVRNLHWLVMIKIIALINAAIARGLNDPNLQSLCVHKSTVVEDDSVDWD